MKYLEEAPMEEAMNVFYSTKWPELHKHRVWTGDFMAMAAHDIPCQVCFNASAILERNVTPGRWKQTVQPCRECQKRGYRTERIPVWVRWILEKTGNVV